MKREERERIETERRREGGEETEEHQAWRGSMGRQKRQREEEVEGTTQEKKGEGERERNNREGAEQQGKAGDEMIRYSNLKYREISRITCSLFP